MQLKPTLSMVIALSCCSSAANADDWLQFRGANASGIVAKMDLPSSWGSESNIKWQVSIPGEGWSAPVIVGNKLFLTTAVSAGQKNKNSEHEWQIICLDATTGKPLWTKVATKGKPRLGTHRDNTYASETPATDGKHVVAYFGMTGVFCYDLDGKELWTKDLGSFPMQNEWGTSSSPVIHGNLVFIQVDNEKQSFLIALDVATGNEVWKKSREEASNWGSPIIWQNSIRTELVTAGRSIRSYNPDDGELLWQLKANTGGISSTPAGNDDLLVVGNQGRQGAAMFAIKAGATGDISLKSGEASNQSVLWSSHELGPQRSSPLVYENQVYLLGQRGSMLTCLDAKTGEKIYQDRLPGGAAFWASPWANNGKVYCPDEQGNTFVIKPGKMLEVVNVNKLPSNDSTRYWATSAASDGSLFIRSTNTLYAVSTH